jgi:hypothetical protein
MEKVDLDKEKQVRKVSKKTDAAEKQDEQDGFNIEFQEAIKRHNAREDALREGLYKAYALIFSRYCTKAMRQRIEEHPDFQSKIEDDPIALLETIKQSMHDPVRAQYPLVRMTDDLVRLLTIQQEPLNGEDLGDYAKKFKQYRDVVKAQLGTTMLDTYVENQPKYQALTEFDADEKDKMKENAFEAWMAYLFIRGSDQAKYGSLVQGFASQFSLQNDQWPKTLSKAMDVLSNHKFDSKHSENMKKHYENIKNKQERQKQQQQQQSQETTNNPTSFAQQEDIICYVCGEYGHNAHKCTKKDSIPKDQYWIRHKQQQHVQNTEQQHTQTGTNENTESGSDIDTRTTVSDITAQTTRGRQLERTSTNSRPQRTQRPQTPPPSATGWSHFQSNGIVNTDTPTTETLVGNQSQGKPATNLKEVLLIN